MNTLVSFFTLKLKKASSSLVTFIAKKVTKETLVGSAAAFIGTVASLSLGLTRLFLWMVGPPRLSKQARLERVLTTLELKKTLLLDRNEAYVKRLDRIARLLHNIQRTKGPIRNRMRGWLDETVKKHQQLLKEKEIPRLTFTIYLLENAKEKLEDEEQN